jgi:hypothetical protein
MELDQQPLVNVSGFRKSERSERLRSSSLYRGGVIDRSKIKVRIPSEH